MTHYINNIEDKAAEALLTGTWSSLGVEGKYLSYHSMYFCLPLNHNNNKSAITSSLNIARRFKLFK